MVSRVRLRVYLPKFRIDDLRSSERQSLSYISRFFAASAEKNELMCDKCLSEDSYTLTVIIIWSMTFMSSCAFLADFSNTLMSVHICSTFPS